MHFFLLVKHDEFFVAVFLALIREKIYGGTHDAAFAVNSSVCDRWGGVPTLCRRTVLVFFTFFTFLVRVECSEGSGDARRVSSAFMEETTASLSDVPIGAGSGESGSASTFAS